MTQTGLEAWSAWKMRGSPEADSRLNDNSRRRAEAKRIALGGTAWLYSLNSGEAAREWAGDSIPTFGADLVGPHDAELVALIGEWRRLGPTTEPRIPAIGDIQARAEAIGAEQLNWS